MIRMAIQVVLVDEAGDRRDVHEIVRTALIRFGACSRTSRRKPSMCWIGSMSPCG